MKIYISGKITGMEAQAAKNFKQAQEMLEARGLEVVNPMELPHQHNKKWSSYMREDIIALCGCDAIYFLKNWTKSAGAQLEWIIASTLGLEVICQENDVVI